MSVITNLSVDTQSTSVMSNVMLNIVKDRDLRNRRNERLKHRKPKQSLIDNAISTVMSYEDGLTDAEDAMHLLFNEDDGVLYMGWYPDGSVTLVWHAESEEKLVKLREWVVDQLEDFTPPIEPAEIHVQFWYLGGDGPTYRSRNLEAPSWPEIVDNYGGPTHDALDSLMQMTEWDPDPGKLILWRSDPGTGKTYALRALCRTWAEWANVSVICDPEVLLQGNPAYLLEVILREDEDKWHLIVLEDSGELVTPGASAEQGQGLSRLLNTVDGLLGQGLKVVFLITTNEDIGKLHEAVSRPGRCAMDLEFSLFNEAEALDWLARHGYTGKFPTGKQSLAQLYALLHKSAPVHQGQNEKVVGFATAMRVEEMAENGKLNHEWNPLEGDDVFAHDPAGDM